jgi:hypothetical protein
MTIVYRFSCLDIQAWPQLKSDFILILPALTKVALSSEEAEVEAICRLILKTSLGPHRLGSSPWDESPLEGDTALLICREVLHQFASNTQMICKRNLNTYLLDMCLQVVESLLRVARWIPDESS